MLNPQQTKQFQEFADELHQLIKKHSEKRVDSVILAGTLMTQCKVLSCLIYPTYEETKQTLERMIDKDLQMIHDEYSQLKQMVDNSKIKGEE